MLIAVGTPMLLMGDEVRRTQRGNNNGYCQDNETSWFDWSLLEKHQDIHRFVKLLTKMRLRVRGLAIASYPLTLNQLLERARIECHGVRLHQPDWSHGSHSLAITASVADGNFETHFMLNAYWEPLSFELPPTPEDESRSWRRWLDTSLEAPDDICELLNAPPVKGSNYLAEPRSIAALARITDTNL